MKIGENVGSYRIISQLGQGGMATVYKAYHAGLDRYVAIKVLHPAFKADPSFLARFQREARVLAKLDHPNIVPIFDFAEHEGQPYLVMKYIEGDTLKDRLANGPVTLAEVLLVVDTVGSALAYAHQQGVLHRDIKPSNVIIASDNHYYLSDFGLARIASTGESTLSQDTMLGTPNYISPEQAKGMSNLDGRTDIYSFGVVLYEMIVGRVPFSGDTPYSVIHDHIYSPLPPPTVVNPKVTEPLEMFLLKALAKDREDRYPDAPAMVAAFHQAAGQPVSALFIPPTGQPAETALSEPNIASPTVARASATLVTPQALGVENAQAPVLPAVQTGSGTLVESVKVAPAKTKKRSVWWILGGTVVLVLCIATIGVLAAGGLTRQNKARQTATAASLTESVPVTVAAATAEPTTNGNSSRVIANAQMTVTANPNSIDALLQLGRAYYDGARFDDAIRAYDQGASLSSYRAVFYSSNVIAPYRADPIFALSVLGNGLRHNTNPRIQLELWLLATPLLEQVTPLPNSETLLVGLAHDFPDRAVVQLALARHYILFKQLGLAQPIITGVYQTSPNDPTTEFVYAEYLAATGKQAEAGAEFGVVIANPQASTVVKQAAQKELDALHGTSTP